MLWSVEAGQGVWLEKKWAEESGVGVAGSLSRPLRAQNWAWTNGKWITLLTHIISTGVYRYTFLEWNLLHYKPSLVYREDYNISSFTIHNINLSLTFSSLSGRICHYVDGVGGYALCC